MKEEIKEKIICKYRGCENEVWRGICNGYCIKHHNEVCMENNNMTTKTNNEWEKRIVGVLRSVGIDDSIPAIKEVIRQELSSERQKLREEIERMRKEHDDEGSGCDCSPQGALADVLKLLEI